MITLILALLFSPSARPARAQSPLPLDDRAKKDLSAIQAGSESFEEKTRREASERAAQVLKDAGKELFVAESFVRAKPEPVTAASLRARWEVVFDAVSTAQGVSLHQYYQDDQDRDITRLIFMDKDGARPEESQPAYPFQQRPTLSFGDQSWSQTPLKTDAPYPISALYRAPMQGAWELSSPSTLKVADARTKREYSYTVIQSGGTLFLLGDRNGAKTLTILKKKS